MNYKTTPMKPFGVLLEPADKGTSVKSLQVEALRKLFSQHHLMLLRGFETFSSAADFSGYCEAWGTVSQWPFGTVLELIEHEKPEDHIFDNSYVPLHWDGMYRPQIPEYQLFHCVKAPLAGQGGRTTFTNTISTLKNASAETKELWGNVTGTYERKMEFYNSKTISPIITKHPSKEVDVIRYNEPPSEAKGSFLNPPNLQFSGVSNEALHTFHQSLQQALYDPKNFYAHEWQSGDVVIADNFSLLHGRERFAAKSPRHLRRVHVLSNPPFNNPGLQSYR